MSSASITAAIVLVLAIVLAQFFYFFLAGGTVLSVYFDGKFNCAICNLRNGILLEFVGSTHPERWVVWVK